MIKEIFDFNARALGVLPKTDLVGLSTKEVAFLVKAAHEEAHELQLAAIGVNEHGGQLTGPEGVVGQVDALIDQAYFAIGGLARLGLTAGQAEACFALVHEANMTKKLGTTHRGDVGVADAAKPANWVGPEGKMLDILFPLPEDQA